MLTIPGPLNRYPAWVLVSAPFSDPVARDAWGQPALRVAVCGERLTPRGLYAVWAQSPGQVDDLAPWSGSTPASWEFQGHSALDANRVLGHVMIGGERIDPQVSLVNSTPAMRVFRASWTTPTATLVLTVRQMHASPVVHYDGWIALPFEATRGEATYFAPVTEPLGIFFDGSSDAAVLPRSVDCPVTREDVVSASPVTARAVRFSVGFGGAQPHGPIYAPQGIDQFGALGDVAFHGDTRGISLTPRAYPCAPEEDANQPGSQRNIGANALGSLKVVGIDGILSSVDDWLLRPTWFSDPANPARVLGADALTAASLEVSDRRIRVGGSLLRYLPPMFVDGPRRRAADEQHSDDHPVHLACALTDDPVAVEVAVMLRVLDAASLRAAKGWRNPAPRGDGRWVRSLARSCDLVGDPGDRGRRAAVARANVIRADMERFPIRHPYLRPWANHQDGGLAIYEYAQAAHGFWLAWQKWGGFVVAQSQWVGDELRHVAYHAALIVAAHLWRDAQGVWRAPFRCGLHPTLVPSEAMLEAERQSVIAGTVSVEGLGMVPGDSDWVPWCVPALSVLTDIVGRETSPEPWAVGLADRARACLADLDGRATNDLAVANFAVEVRGG